MKIVDNPPSRHLDRRLIRAATDYVKSGGRDDEAFSEIAKVLVALGEIKEPDYRSETTGIHTVETLCYFPGPPITIASAAYDMRVNGIKLYKGETIKVYPDNTWKIY